MPRYMVERLFDVGQDQMDGVGRRSRLIIEGKYPSITWDHSHVSIDDDGRVRTFCLYEAGSEDEIRSHAKQLGFHEIQRVTEIVGDVTPADFPS
jgi:hypothetical protein